ncbi:LysR substrate-binding domain-containing protein [Streptomyces sp. NPDC054933]
MSGLRGVRLRVAAFGTAATSLVVPALLTFRQRHRGVRLTFTEAEPEDAVPPW